jgi:predicted MFS family arabinose efflux permease
MAVMVISATSLTASAVLSFSGILLAGLLLVYLIRIESTSKERLLPTGSYQLTSPIGSTYTIMTLLAMATATEIFIPYLLQTLHGHSPLVAGYLTALEALGWSVASILFSGLKLTGARRAILIGPIMMALGLLGLGWLLPNTWAADGVGLVTICGLLFFVGAGIGVGWPHLLTQVLTSANPSERQLASSSITTIQLLATAFGAALAGMIANMAGLINPGGTVGAAKAAQCLCVFFALAPILAFVIAYLRVSKYNFSTSTTSKQSTTHFID